MKIDTVKIGNKIMQVGALVFMMLVAFVVLSGSTQAAACTPASGFGSVTRTGVTVSAAGTHNVWVRMQAGDALANSVGVEVTPSGGSPSCMVATSQSTTSWEWRNAGSITVTQTGNTLKLVGLAANVKVDKVLLVPTSSSCTPSNRRDTTKNPIEEPGDNCVVSSTTTVSPTTTTASPTVTTQPPTPSTPVPPTTQPPLPPTVDKNPPTSPSKISRSLVLDATRFRYNLQLKWLPSADAEGGIKYYSVMRSDGLGSNALSPVYTDDAVVANTKYTYTIQAFDMAGNASKPVQTSLTARCFFIWCWLE